VPDQDHGPVDLGDDASDILAVAGQAAQGVGGRLGRDARALQPGMTRDQLGASANAPWTSTMVGLSGMTVSFRLVWELCHQLALELLVWNRWSGVGAVPESVAGRAAHRQNDGGLMMT